MDVEGDREQLWHYAVVGYQRCQAGVHLQEALQTSFGNFIFIFILFELDKVNFRFKIEGASGIIFSSRFIDKPLLSLSNSKTYSKSPLSENPKAISSTTLSCSAR